MPVTTDAAPILLLTAPGEGHPFDAYLREILLTEGYNCFDEANAPADAAELARYSLVIISSGAASATSPDTLRAYIEAGGKAIVLRPPAEWAPMFGLAPVGDAYSLVRDAYLSVSTDHPWMRGFAEPELQCPGEADVYVNESADVVAFLAGQLRLRSDRPAVAAKKIGQGIGVVFTYDLPDTIVQTHQGRPENASTGANPDANGDGKFCPDDALFGMRDFSLRHVPQADIHQDILVRVIRGLTGDAMPVPRLWHFPGAAPAAFLVDGDGDSMIWSDLEWTIRNVEEFGAKYTLFLMNEQIEAFSREGILEIRDRGHEFGVHPWVNFKPTVREWEAEVGAIVSRFATKFGFQPTSLRSHSCIFPGWVDTPRIYAERGLRLDTSFAPGYQYVSGYMNGSALPVKFADGSGGVIDCYEQNTVQTEDGSCTPKCLLPLSTEAEATELAMELMRRCAEVHHGVYHPYFHPISLAGRTPVSCQQWFREVLRAARDRGLPSLNTREWIRFNDARRAVTIRSVSWNPGEATLSFVLRSPMDVTDLTILLPPCMGLVPIGAGIDGDTTEIAPVPFENLDWTALGVDLAKDDEIAVRVAYGRATA